MKTWESDAGVKVCKFTEAEKVPEQMLLSYHISKKPASNQMFLPSTSCMTLSVLTLSYSLFFFLNKPMFTSSQLVACSSS